MQGEPIKKELQTPEGKWSYLTSQEGEKALLFIHGASSSNKIWKYQYGLKIEAYKNIFVDLLGYGESEKPESGYTLANWISGLHAILEQEKVEKVAIVAHSNGVIFAKEFYRRYPDQVDRLILLDGMLKLTIPKQMLGWMKNTLERSDYEEYMKKNVQMMPVAGLQEEDAAILRKDGLETPKRISQAEFELVSSDDTWQEILISCPTMILHSNNPFWTKDYLSWLKTVAPDHHFKVWKDSGHFVQLQYPARLEKLIREAMGE
ncbi:MAG: alpha/beta hydrolase [Bacteroidia bacterium]|nr:alpha/beta hydrolase [Bacteroidia bacterium]